MYWREFIFGHERYLVRKEIINKIWGLKCSADVLDVGSGDSRYKDLFIGHKYYTQDICLDDNFGYKKIDYNCDLEELVNRKLEFDFILCTFVLEHVFDFENFISKMAKLTRSNGNILITTAFSYFEHAKPHDYFRFSRNAFNKLIQERFADQFEIIECRPLDKIFTYMLNFSINLPFYFCGNNSLIAKILLIILSPIVLILRFAAYLLDYFDKKNNMYCVIYLYLRKK